MVFVALFVCVFGCFLFCFFCLFFVFLEGSEQPKQKSSLDINVLSVLTNDIFTTVIFTSKAEENSFAAGINS